MITRSVPVTKSSLPSLKEYVDLIETCWENSWLTNNGPLVQRLESELKQHLKTKHLLLTNNGTIALQLAIHSLNLKKEIITTPFSYVATTSSILWENCKPVFVDINPDDLCIDAEKIEAKITKDTEAILAVHVYGNPCDVIRIEAIAKKYNLKVIYDAAHAFGVRYNDVPLTNFGDASILSFHATKLFHCIEGGAILTQSDELSSKINLCRSFGHVQDEHFVLGINGKMNEFQAAMGICNLPKMSEVICNRKLVFELYESAFQKLELIKRVKPRVGTQMNYSYYPIILKDEASCLKLQKRLREFEITTRRYFYPSLNALPYVEYQSCPISEDISSRILCLPLYSDLSIEDASYVIEKIYVILREL